MRNPFKYFNSSPEVIRIAVLMYVKYPLSLRNVEDLLAERGIWRVTVCLLACTLSTELPRALVQTAKAA
jgi:transposase-like protein